MIRKLKLVLLSSGFARILCIPACFIVFILVATFVSTLTAKKPKLERIVPPVSAKGEVIAIEGTGFGDERGSQWLEISGDRISSSAYISWSDTKILFVIPENYDDGLIRLCSRNGQSNMLVFARRENIPEESTRTESGNIPSILSVKPVQSAIGKVISLSGLNFGITRGTSGVLFTKTQDNYPDAGSAGGVSGRPLILQEDADFGYDFWSDQEIRVRVPDGASTGPVYVQTARGMSVPVTVRIADMPGTKRFENQRVYVISEYVDITGVAADSGGNLFLRVPIPVTTASQQNIKLRESSPAPYMENYRGTILHQFENLKTGSAVSVSHSFVLTNSDVVTSINVQRVRAYDTDSPLYKAYTVADQLIPAHDGAIRQTLGQIAGANHSNPYRRAEAIYNWILDHVRYESTTNANKNPLSALDTGAGDAYDMTVLFCALARTAGVPAVPSAGIIVDMKQNSLPHWWAEFYIENFGWIPVDLGMGAGFPYIAEHDGEAPRDWYFGNIDGNRIAFSRGWTHQTPMTANSKTVYNPRSFAFQRIWEESDNGLTSYTSLWGTPKIIGVY